MFIGNNRKVVEAWISQSHTEGQNRNRSLWFEGTVIYSYGKHFPIARIVNHSNIFLNSGRYSNTTAKQINIVVNAIHRFSFSNVWTVPEVEKPGLKSHIKNLLYLEQEAREFSRKFLNARKNVGYWHTCMKNATQNYKAYIKVFEIVIPSSEIFSDEEKMQIYNKLSKPKPINPLIEFPVFEKVEVEKL